MSLRLELQYVREFTTRPETIVCARFTRSSRPRRWTVVACSEPAKRRIANKTRARMARVYHAPWRKQGRGLLEIRDWKFEIGDRVFHLQFRISNFEFPIKFSLLS